MENEVLASVLKGSVIPLLPLRLQKEFNPKKTRMMREHEQHLETHSSTQAAARTRKPPPQNIHLINELKNAIMMRYRMK